MAKKEKAATADTTTETKESKGRKVMITKVSGGEPEARVDVIKALFADGTGKSRSEIVKVLKDEYNHEVPYQIVFAATKKNKGEAATTEAAADTSEAEAA